MQCRGKGRSGSMQRGGQGYWMRGLIMAEKVGAGNTAKQATMFGKST